jgi:hypothetical protein
VGVSCRIWSIRSLSPTRQTASISPSKPLSSPRELLCWTALANVLPSVYGDHGMPNGTSK